MRLRSYVGMVSIVMLTGCSCPKYDQPVLNGHYLILPKGTSWTAPEDTTLVDLQVVKIKDQMILELLQALKKYEVAEDLEK